MLYSYRLAEKKDVNHTLENRKLSEVDVERRRNATGSPAFPPKV